MIRIGLFNGGSMSDLMLLEKMGKYARENGVEAEIRGYAISEIENEVENIDVALLAPQLKFEMSSAQPLCIAKGVSMEVISAIDYRKMDGKRYLTTQSN